VALSDHDVREARRRAENEAETRRALEKQLGETTKKLQEEISRRSKEQSSSMQTGEKIGSLERQIDELNKKLHIEADSHAKLKKLNAELSMTIVGKDQALNDVQREVTSLTNAKEELERSQTALNSQIQVLRASVQQSDERRVEIEAQKQSIMAEMERLKALNAKISDELDVLRREHVALEKSNAMLKVEFKNAQVKHLEETKAQRDLIQTLQSQQNRVQDRDREVEAKRSLQAMLDDEKLARQKAENLCQEKDRQLTMLSVDYRQLEQQISKLEGDHRQEAEKGRALKSQLDETVQNWKQTQSQLAQVQSELGVAKTIESDLRKQLQRLTERDQKLQNEMADLKAASNIEQLHMKELQDQLEAEQYFSTLYKTQIKELKEDLDDKSISINEWTAKVEATNAQLRVALATQEADQAAKKTLEEKLAELERQQIQAGFERQNELAKMESDFEAKESDLKMRLEQIESESKKRIGELEEEISVLKERPVREGDGSTAAEIEKLKHELSKEQLLKQQAVNKLAEVLNRKPVTRAKGSVENRKKDKEFRKLQQDLNQEREKFHRDTERLQKEIQDVQAQLNEESQKALRLKMEIDSKDSEIEQLRSKLAVLTSETGSMSSGTGDDSEESENRLEGWIMTPIKQNFRRHGWKKQYCVVSSKKILFYDSEQVWKNIFFPQFQILRY
jgi:Rho-associated protein kinase 2